MNPFIFVVAREMSGPLTSLVKQLDEATIRFSDGKLRGSVVFYSDQPDLEGILKDLVQKEELKNVVLSIRSAAGHVRYPVPVESEVTVVAYNRRRVLFSFVFRKGELNDEATTKVLAVVPDLIKQK